MQRDQAIDTSVARFVIIGAGVAGTATAWRLSKAGHKVMLVDRHDEPCSGASHRNGAQLSYSYCDALASPSLLAKMPAILLGHEPAFRVRLQADPRFLLWGLRFALNSMPGAFEANTRHLLELAMASQALLPKLMAEFQIAFDYKVAGKLVLCHTADSLDRARAGVCLKQSLGIDIRIIDRADAEKIEPALGGYADHFAGAIYSPNDAVGNPSRFCEELIVGLVKNYGLRTLYQAEATRILKRNGRVTGVAFLNHDPEECDGVVVATGYDAQLVGGLADFGAIWPVQGYSVTVPAKPESMQVSITDPMRRLVFARLGKNVRIAGIADIGRRDFTFDRPRYETLKEGVAAAFPGSFDLTTSEGWSDARPCTPSSRPLIGRGTARGLYMNIGHGTLGWTLCLGSAERLNALVEEDLA